MYLQRFPLKSCFLNVSSLVNHASHVVCQTKE